MSRRRLIAVFVAVTCVPGATVLWLGGRLLQQDKKLEAQYKRDRHEQAADRAVRSLQAALSEPSLFRKAPEAGAILVSDPTGPMLFRPYPAALDEAPPELFRAGEESEHGGDLARAAEVYLHLTTAKGQATRAGAWFRLARTLRNRHHPKEALAAFDELARFGGVAVEGWPAALAAAWGRCLVFEDEKMTADLFQSARQLRIGLDAGQWPLTRASYDIFADDAARWTREQRPREAEMLTEAANALQERVRRGDDASEGRRSTFVGGELVTLVWKPVRSGNAVFAASSSFVQRVWLARTQGSVWLRDEEGRSFPASQSRDDAILRYPAETKLPWIVAIGAPVSGDGLTTRRDILVLLLAVVAAFTLGGGYFILRALRREFALARMQSDFVSAVSHEFRTPLTSMQLITEALVDERIPDPARLRDSYLSLSRSTQRLYRLVEDLLDFRRMESNSIEYRLRPIDAGEVVSAVVAEFRREIDDRGFQISVGTEAGARVKGDETALGRALWNLLDNAAKYSGDNRQIEVRVERNKGEVRISVSDRGIGIPSQDRARLFTSFYRAENAKRAGIRGTGIGLAMVAQIVTAHGGRVSVESEPERGSTFTMSLPLEE